MHFTGEETEAHRGGVSLKVWSREETRVSGSTILVASSCLCFATALSHLPGNHLSLFRPPALSRKTKSYMHRFGQILDSTALLE